MEQTKINLSNQGGRTTDEVIEEMNTIWAHVKRAKMDPAAAEKYLEEVQSVHRPLYEAYPTVLRHMIQERHYHPEAFKLYLRRVGVKPWGNDEERMDSYADYYMMLYRKTNKHYNQTALTSTRQAYVKRLKEEHEEFMRLYQAAERLEVEREKQRLRAARGARLVTLQRELGLPQDRMETITRLLESETITDADIETIISRKKREDLKAVADDSIGFIQ